jgi:hypothetical protein
MTRASSRLMRSASNWLAMKAAAPRTSASTTPSVMPMSFVAFMAIPCVRRLRPD